MNTLELTQKLFDMARNQQKYKMNWCIGIINAIIVQYLTMSNFYEENAIKTFSDFLKTGVLNW